MRIAVVRGPSLNPWEMQNYFPLARRHELRLIGGKGKRVKGLRVQGFNKVCLGEVFSFFPGGIEFLYRCFGDPQILLGLERAVIGFDIVHSAELANYYSFQAVKARQKGLVKRVVVTCWENIAGAREKYPAQKRIKRQVARGADHFLAVTEGARKTLLAEGVEGKRITVVPMGVDIKKLKIPAKGWSASGGKNEKLKTTKKNVKLGKSNILFVGRLEEEKGIWELLKAFRIFNGLFPSTSEESFDKPFGHELRADWLRTPRRCLYRLRLTMVGRGSQEGKIKTWLKENHLEEAVRLKGWVEYGKIWQEYRRADIFVLPSKPTPAWQEQFGMVLVEAMASGLPIVATRSGAIPEVVGEAGILVEPGRVGELAEAIGKLIKSESLRKSLRVKGFKRARERYDCEKVAGKIERVYREVLMEA